MDIWEDGLSMVLLINGHLEINAYDVSKIDRAKKWVMKYHWFECTLFFKGLVIFKLAKRTIIEKIHEEIGHFGESWTFAEVKKKFF